MADITKCTNQNCPIKGRCYRYTAKDDSKWQSYSYFEPYEHNGRIKCDHYVVLLDSKEHI